MLYCKGATAQRRSSAQTKFQIIFMAENKGAEHRNIIFNNESRESCI